MQGIGKTSDIYFQLVRRFPLRPIRSEKELTAAIKVVNGLVDRFDHLDDDEHAYLSVLGDLVKKYEDEHVAWDTAIPDHEILAFLIEQKNLTQSVVARETAIAESTISAVLKGTRRLTRDHIGRLAKFFHVPPSVFDFSSE